MKLLTKIFVVFSFFIFINMVFTPRVLANQQTLDITNWAVPEKLKVPILGEIDTQNLSLPLLSVVIGILDGFNPCAMWTLIFLISLLLGMKDKKRMWILGGTFIAASAFVYFLFLSAWLNFFLILGFVFWIRVAIGLVALGAGIYSLRDFYINRSGACKVTDTENRKKTLNKLKNITHKRKFIAAFFGIIILAFAVNLIELVCSAGLPAVYTQVLSLNDLPALKYYLYILIYIFFFMVDDLFVFIIAMVTLHAVGIQTKYARFSRLIGGAIMVIIGILLLFKPELLMFG
jgi:hypothetical protein